MKMKRNDYFLQRSFNAEVRAAGQDSEKKGHVVEGLAAVYEQESRIADYFGEFVEVIRKGAFDDCDFSDVRLLVNHDFNGIALARSRRNNKSDKPNTMQLYVNDDGVHITADLDTENNEQARAVYSAISRGDMDGMSFCFYVEEDGQRWTKEDGVERREILKVSKVIEVSVVNFPAYSGTNIDARSLDSDKRALESARQLLESREKRQTINHKAKSIITMYKRSEIK